MKNVIQVKFRASSSGRPLSDGMNDTNGIQYFVHDDKIIFFLFHDDKTLTGVFTS